jgi:hypothetical protein
MKNVKALFEKYDVVEGFYLDEMYQASNGDITVLRYVSKYDETAKCNVIENALDKVHVKLLGINSSTFIDELTAIVYKKAKEQGINTFNARIDQVVNKLNRL